MGDTLKCLKAWPFSRDYVTLLFYNREYITGVTICPFFQQMFIKYLRCAAS